MEIYKKIPEIMNMVGSVSKGRRNESQGYMFRGIEDMYEAFHPAFIKHGVFVAPNVIETKSETIDGVNAQGKPKTSFRVVMRVEHKFYAADGSSISTTTVGEGLDTSDKASNKAMSAAYKYALMQTFCIPTQDVADSDRESPEAPVGLGNSLGAKPISSLMGEGFAKPKLQANLVAPKKEADKPKDVGDTVIDLGSTLKGKTFKEVGEAGMRDFVERTVGHYGINNKPMPPAVSALVLKADEWLDTFKEKK